MDKMRAWVRNHPIISGIIIEAVVLLLMHLFSFLLALLLKTLGLLGLPEYTKMFMSEFLAAALGFGILLLIGNGYVYKRKTSNFFAGWIPGGYFIVVALLAGPFLLLKYFYTQLGVAIGVEYSAQNIEAFQTALQATTTDADALRAMLQNLSFPLNPFYEIVCFFATMFLVGFFEETLFRGIIAENLLRKFGTSPAGVWKATLLCGAMFGMAHLVNLFFSNPYGVFVQAFVTIFMGMAFVAIYYRTGNIWTVIFLHAFVDGMQLIVSGIFAGQAGISATISGYSWTNLLGVIPYIIVILVVYRKSKITTISKKMDFIDQK